MLTPIGVTDGAGCGSPPTDGTIGPMSSGSDASAVVSQANAPTITMAGPRTISRG